MSSREVKSIAEKARVVIFPSIVIAKVAATIGRYQSDLWMTSYESAMFIDGAAVGFSAAAPRTISEVA